MVLYHFIYFNFIRFINFCYFYKSKIDLKSAAIAQRNILNNKTFMLGRKFQIRDEKIKNFFKNEFLQSNNKLEKLYNLEINKFLI